MSVYTHLLKFNCGAKRYYTTTYFPADCEHTVESAEESADEAFFEPLLNDCPPSKKYKHLHRQMDYIKTHEWPRFQQLVKENNERVDGTYERMSRSLKTSNMTPIIPFTADKLHRGEPTFCDYLSTYFTTIRGCRRGRRRLVKRRTFEKKFDQLKFYDPVRLKLSFRPPPLEDYGRYKFHSEMFDHFPQFQHTQIMTALGQCEPTDEYICRQCDFSICTLRDGCFISHYYRPVCNGLCPHCEGKRETSCQVKFTPLEIPDECSHPSASLILRRNWRDPDSGILLEGPPSDHVDASIRAGATSECKGGEKPKISDHGILELPLCCACSCDKG